MEISAAHQYPTKMFLEKLRKTPLMVPQGTLVYCSASMRMCKLEFDEFEICQRYVLKEQLEIVRGIHLQLSEKGINIFNLQGHVEFVCHVGETKKIMTITPPIIEYSKADQCLLLNDGMHRVFTAWQLGIESINCALIENIPEAFPYYAFPFTEGLSGVQVLDHIPEGFIKKEYRLPSPRYRKLFRDFNIPFENVSFVRNVGKS